jgi:cytochrome c553
LPRSRRHTVSRRAALLAALSLTACRQDLHDQPRYKPLAPSTLFTDGRSARPLVEGTVPNGELREDELLYTGKVHGKLADALPMPVSTELLARGAQRFDIFCAPCHGKIGDGQGLVVRRGFRQPPSYHQDRLRAAPAGHYFDVMTRGFGVMLPYASRLCAEDRWAVVAYIRALQLSQNATLNDVPETERRRLETVAP